MSGIQNSELDRKMESKRALNEKEAAAYIGMSVSFLQKDRLADGRPRGHAPGPRYIKIGRAVRYLVEDLDAWLDARRLDPRSLPAA